MFPLPGGGIFFFNFIKMVIYLKFLLRNQLWYLMESIIKKWNLP